MGPYLFGNAALAGFFAFGAIYHLVLWTRTRREMALLAFAALSLLSSVNSYAVLTIATAHTVAEGQGGLDLRAGVAGLIVVALVWLFALMSGVRARWYVRLVTATFSVLSARTVLVPHLTGTVTAIRQIVMPWGEPISTLERSGASLFLPVAYGVALSVPIFGLICARRLWQRDRVGAVLVSVSAIVYLSSFTIGVSIDMLGSALPYLSPIVGACWILPVAWQVGRANRHQADTLVATERRFRFLVQNQTEFVVSCLPDATLTFVNDSYCRYFGITFEDAIGSNLLDRFASDARDAIERQVSNVSLATPVSTGEHIVHAKNGERRWTSWTVSGVFSSSGTLSDLQMTGRDIHERVVAEEGKRQLEQQLLQSQKMEALGQLAGGVAHDFNNLLTVIAGHTDMLLSGKRDVPARKDLEQIRVASDRAASLTRQLLAFSRQSVLEPKVISLNSVVAETETMLRPTMGEGINLIVRASPDLHSVKADPDQMARVLLNIAINARDAMPNGGTLVIETRNVTERDEIVLAMTDTGCGMSADTKAHLFEPFFTTKGHGKGTGLGLAVVDGIVKQSGGRIDVRSEPGAGTTFEIYLPAIDHVVARAPVRSEARSPALGTETVLLVEDEAAVREMTQEALRRRGYRVLPAASGAQALQIAHDNHGQISLVLTDVVMPGMSGPQLVERLRAEYPQLAALFMSGYTSDAVLRHGVETGEADFLQKPFSTSALAAKIRQVLDRV